MNQVSCYLFSLTRTSLKLDNISVTPKMVKKVIKNLDLSKASGPDCIPRVSSVVSIFKSTGERSTAKNYCPVSGQIAKKWK